MTIHHIYNDRGDITIWTGDDVIAARSEQGEVVVTYHYAFFRFTAPDPNEAARRLANILFNTNKEYAS